MFRIDRIAVWIFIGAFALLVTSIEFFNFIDEIVAVLLLSLACVDSLLNSGAWRKYIPMWILLGIMCFYAVYSMTAVHYTTRLPIIIDILIESKPFICLFVMMGIRPTFTAADRTLLRIFAVINIVVCAFLLPMPNRILAAVIQHISYGGIFIFLSTMVFFLCSIREDGSLTPTSKLLVVVFAAAGLMCGRSKYYAEFVMILFFMFAYRPGMLRHITLKQIMVVTTFVVLVGIVTWKKFSYYFLVGNSGATTFDPETIQSFARPVLYATSLLIFADHFPFGTGLASFASYRSIEPYSGVYTEYGIDKVYGLSPNMPDFICDAYYPSLAQFGVAGVALFIWLITYIIRTLGRLIRLGGPSFKNLYAVGMLSVAFVLIESTTGTAMVNCGGVMAMMIIGIVGGRALALSDSTTSQSL